MGFDPQTLIKGASDKLPLEIPYIFLVFLIDFLQKSWQKRNHGRISPDQKDAIKWKKSAIMQKFSRRRNFLKTRKKLLVQSIYLYRILAAQRIFWHFRTFVSNTKSND